MLRPLAHPDESDSSPTSPVFGLSNFLVQESEDGVHIGLGFRV